MVDIFHRKGKLQSLCFCLVKSHHCLECCRKVFDLAHQTKEVFCFALESACAEDWLLHLCLPKGLLNDRSHISKEERYSEFYILRCFFSYCSGPSVLAVSLSICSKVCRKNAAVPAFLLIFLSSFSFLMFLTWVLNTSSYELCGAVSP